MSNIANPYSIISAKQIAGLLECSENTGKKIYNDIKKEYELPKYVLLIHFQRYFKVQNSTK